MTVGASPAQGCGFTGENLEKTGGSVKEFSDLKIQVLAHGKGWSPVQTKGYLDGLYSRRRGIVPSKYAQVGIDEYCLAFRAGYYGRTMQDGTASGNRPAPKAKPQRSSSS